MPCRIAEFAHQLAEEDKSVIQNEKSFKFLGHYCYAKDAWYVLLGEKQPYKNKDNKTVGVLVTCTDVTEHQYLLNYAALVYSDAKFLAGGKSEQFTYILDSSFADYKLTKRQGECLYYLLRGKNTKAIAYVLGISVRTAEDYINQLKLKFDCHTKNHLCEKSIALGLLRFVPDSALQHLRK